MTTNKKILSIELYRGAASLAVLFYHLSGAFLKHFQFDPLRGLAHHGYLGVDFFFVLSGFVIMHSHYGENGQPNKIRAYLAKRFFRIFPTYWCHLILIIGIRLLGWYFLQNYHSTEALSTTNILKNIILVKPEKYLIGPAWSLSYELFFYLLFAFLFFIGRNGYLVIAGVYTLLITFQSVHYESFFTDTFIVEFFLGNLSALALNASKNWTPNQLRLSAHIALSLGAFLLTGFAIYIYMGGNVNAHFKLLRIFDIGLASTLIIYASCVLEKIGQKVPLIASDMGRISYSLYISHGIFVSLFEQVATKIAHFNLIALNLIYLSIIAFCIFWAISFNTLIEKRIAQYVRRRDPLSL